MEFIRGAHNLRPRHRGCVVTIGNFDGVHLGHQAVLRQLEAIAAELRLPTVLALFEPQPREFFAPEAAPPRLTRLREKLEALRALPIDRVLCLRFDARLASLSPQAFIEGLLVRKLGARHVVVGDDFRFGHNRAGDTALLAAAGPQHGFAVSGMATHELDGARVSSTRVRDALARGDLACAAGLLGRPYSMSGRVGHGDRRGRQIGFPTANLPVGKRALPMRGVFAVRVHAAGGGAGRAGVANLGVRPTVDGHRALLEVHLLDYEGDLYGRRLRVEFVHKLREERRFESLEALMRQISEDAGQARARLAG